MKKETKTELTKERILQAAIEEFGTNGYAGSALNAVCGGHGIAKGLLYHNFSGKDDLYLACVSRCFSAVADYLKTQDGWDDPEKYIRLRLSYFSEHPLCARIFFEAMLQPPAALRENIREIREPFDRLNRQIYRAMISGMTLRDGISEEDALEYCEVMQEMFNGYFSSPAFSGKDFQTLMLDHEEWLPKMMDLMLYGIGKKREN